MNILQFILGLFTGKAGESIGGTVSGIAQLTAMAAFLAPVGLWINANRNEVFITLTYADVALYAVFMLFVVRIVHRAAPPGQ